MCKAVTANVSYTYYDRNIRYHTQNMLMNPPSFTMQNQVSFMPLLINPYSISAAYMRQWIGSTLVQKWLVACSVLNQCCVVVIGPLGNNLNDTNVSLSCSDLGKHMAPILLSAIT